MHVRVFLFELIACFPLLALSQDSGEEPECFEPGECTSSLYLHSWPTDDPQECLELCQGYDGCNYFVHKGDEDICEAFANCQEVSSTCQDCYVGKPDCEDLVCWVRDSCQWNLVDSAVTSREDECLQMCKANTDCLWFTYQADDHFCALMDGCVLVEEECSTCWTGQTQCSERKDSEKILVVGGRSAVVTNLDTAAAYDLSAEGTCQAVANYPISEKGSTGAFVGGAARVCGGYLEGDVSTNKCYEYDYEGNRWLAMPSMISPRYQAKSSALDTNTWLITGGWDNTRDPGEILATTEVWSSADGTFTEGPPLLAPLSDHCQVTLNASHIFIGGNNTGTPAYLLDWERKEWTVLPDMMQNSETAGCGYVYNSAGEQEVVMVDDQSSQILSLADLTWKKGPELAGYDQRGGSVQLKDTFLVVGGQGVGDPAYLDTIYRFDNLNYGWTPLAETLDEGTRQPTAILVPDEMFAC